MLYKLKLLYNNCLFGTVGQPSSANISGDGVLKSVFKIMRAARFCNFDIRSILYFEVVPQVFEP